MTMLIKPSSRYILQMIPQHKNVLSVAIRVAKLYKPGVLLVTQGDNHMVHSLHGEKEDQVCQIIMLYL